jgi:hypothetical protein
MVCHALWVKRAHSPPPRSMILQAPGNLVLLHHSLGPFVIKSALISVVLVSWSFSKVRNPSEGKKIYLLKIDTISWITVSQAVSQMHLFGPQCWWSDSVVHDAFLAHEFLTPCSGSTDAQESLTHLSWILLCDVSGSFTICTAASFQVFVERHPLPLASGTGLTFLSSLVFLWWP